MITTLKAKWLYIDRLHRDPPTQLHGTHSGYIGTHLSITHTVPVYDDPIREHTIDLVVVMEGRGHSHLEIVSQLLSCGLEHCLRIVPVWVWLWAELTSCALNKTEN